MHPSIKHPGIHQTQSSAKSEEMPAMVDARVYRGSNIDSDHWLVIALFRLKLAKKDKYRKGKIFDVQCLKQPDR